MDCKFRSILRKEKVAVRRNRCHRHIVIVAALAVVCSMSGLAQTSQDSLWQPLKVFVGSWKGKGGGEPGNGDYERSYQFVLGKRFIEIRNKSTYPPSEKNPKGEFQVYSQVTLNRTD